jgi:hypothetical protein
VNAEFFVLAFTAAFNPKLIAVDLLLILVPWLFLELWPAATTAFLRRSQAWLAGHVRQLAAWICGLLGVYLVISASVRLA